MFNQIYLLTFCLSGLLASAAAAEWTLVWADEFEVDGRPNAANWNYEQGFVRNNELQWYQPENAFCENGYLVIEGRRERKPNPEYNPHSKKLKHRREFIEYTAASLRTKGLHDWLYGRFEVRAKIVAEEGLWPAIWFLGLDKPWPSNGEIDLMEYYDDSILANACWESKRKGVPTWDSIKTPVSELGGDDWDEAFHVWRMDWDATSIRLYVDDRLLNTIELEKVKNEGGRGPENPFNHPQYLLLNLAIGGDQGGDPSTTAFPSRYLIDYVRVYQK